MVVNSLFSFLLWKPESMWLSVISTEGKCGNLRPVAGMVSVVCDLRLLVGSLVGVLWLVVTVVVTGGRGLAVGGAVGRFR